MVDLTLLFAEAFGGIIGGLFWAIILYGIYYLGKRALFAFTDREKPEFMTKGAKLVFGGFAVLGLLTTVMVQVDDPVNSTSQEVEWFSDSSYLGDAPTIYMQDLTFSPPQGWESVAADIDRGFSSTRVVAPRNGTAAVLVARMPYNATHDEFFSNQSVDIFRRNLQASDRTSNLSFGEIEIYDNNYTKWFVYNASGTYKGHEAKYSYQVSVSQGTYYVLMYYGAPGDFRKYYEPAISQMRNASLYHPISLEIPEYNFEPLNVTPVSPYAGFEKDLGLKEGYSYIRNESLKGTYSIEIESTSSIQFVVFPQDEYQDFRDGYNYDRLVYQEGSNIDIEREFLEGNYTLYTLNSEGGHAQLSYNITRLNQSSE